MSAFVCFYLCCALLVVRPSQPPQPDITFHARSCLHEEVPAFAERRWDRSYRQDTTVNDLRRFLVGLVCPDLHVQISDEWRTCVFLLLGRSLSMKQVSAEPVHISATSAHQILAMFKLIGICSCLLSFQRLRFEHFNTYSPNCRIYLYIIYIYCCWWICQTIYCMYLHV